jgi:hypothetical protein
MKYFIFAFSLIVTNVYFSQEKRLSGKYVSPEIKNYISTNYPTIKKIKFYQEKQKDSIFIEAEFQFGKDEIALKFYNNQLIEKETELEFDEIDENCRTNITSYLTKEYTKYTISECNTVDIPGKKKQFEIYFKGVKNNQSNYYEIYFDEKGNFIKLLEREVSPIQSLF